ncbi:hypothetical protein EVA_14017 [gut metagenome]|uniref:Uncharacterized protein n=1 Tax=gut metagenome TaxID=749906 RepID=J9CD17_9ZZZZ
MSIFVGNISQHIEHQGTFHAVNSGIDFFNKLLFFCGILLLYNSLYVAVCVADNAAIAEGIIHNSSKNSCSCAGCFVSFVEFFQLYTVQQRGITAQNHSSALKACQCFFGLHNCVTGAELFCLQHNFALGAYHFFHKLSFVAYDNNLFSSTCCGGCVNNVLEHSFAAYLMQHLGQLTAHTSAFAGSQNYSNQFRHFYSSFLSSLATTSILIVRLSSSTP